MTGVGVRLAALALSWTAVGAGHALRGRLWRGLAWFGLTAAMFLALPWTGFAGLIFALLVRFLVAPADSALVLPGPPPRVHVVVLVSAGLVLASVLGAMAVRVYFVEAFKVPSAGMAPTLAVGDLFFVDKRATDPAVGDVIVFRHPQRPERDFVQRVVGVAGDRIAVRGGALSRNGAAVPTRALERPCSLDDRAEGGAAWFVEQGPCAEQQLGRHRFRIMVSDPPNPQEDFPEPPAEAYTVPPGHVFAMGDNRGNSNDSRFWGPVPLGNIKGTATYVWLSNGPQGIRWDRIGGRVE